MRYSIELRDWISVTCNGSLTFDKKDRYKYTYKYDKYSKELLIHHKQFATDAFKTTSKTVIQITAETTGDLMVNKIVDKTTRTAS